MIKFKQKEKPVLTEQEQWAQTDRRIKWVGWATFILSLFLFFLSIWTPGESAGRLAGTAFIVLVVSMSQAVWYAIRNT